MKELASKFLPLSCDLQT